jgi:hypothetical protein
MVMTHFEIRDVPRQDTAVVPVSTAPEGIAAVMGTALGKAFSAVERAGVAIAGPPFTRYFSFGPDGVDFEAGLPVGSPIGPDGDVKPGTLGGVRAAVAMHVGPYDTLGRTYEALTRWAVDQGQLPAGAMWEHYLSDPEVEPDPSTWRTEIFMPLA